MNPEIPNAQCPMPGLLTGGQPSEAQLEKARDAGYRAILNLRGLGEPGTDVEAAIVECLGMSYVHLPVSGPVDISVEKARELAVALEQVEEPVMVHCASGNRVGALFALKAFHLDGRSVDEALAIGRSSGLTRMEPLVRSLLG
jgi:uncharacterized protein (TIGR01244 family)